MTQLKHEFASHLRQNQTPTELLLWQRIRNRQLLGLKFRRQQPIGPYVVDFYCSDIKLVIEIDGDVHCLDGHAEDDLQREQYLKSHGLLILRFTTQEILKSLDDVMESILLTITVDTPHRGRKARQPLELNRHESLANDHSSPSRGEV